MFPTPTNDQSQEVSLPDNSRYSFTISTYEMKNALGNIVANLQEYTFTKLIPLAPKVSYKIYRTKEGNWYELDTDSCPQDAEVIRKLKNAFEIHDRLV